MFLPDILSFIDQTKKSLDLLQNQTRSRCLSSIFASWNINKYWSTEFSNIPWLRIRDVSIRIGVNRCGRKRPVPCTSKLVQSARFRASPFKVLFPFLPAVLRPIELRREQHALPGTLFSNRRCNTDHYRRKYSTDAFSWNQTHLTTAPYGFMNDSSPVRPRVIPYEIGASTDTRLCFHQRLWPTSADVVDVS